MTSMTSKAGTVSLLNTYGDFTGIEFLTYESILI